MLQLPRVQQLTPGECDDSPGVLFCGFGSDGTFSDQRVDFRLLKSRDPVAQLDAAEFALS